MRCTVPARAGAAERSVAPAARARERRLPAPSLSLCLRPSSSRARFGILTRFWSTTSAMTTSLPNSFPWLITHTRPISTNALNEPMVLLLPLVLLLLAAAASQGRVPFGSALLRGRRRGSRTARCVGSKVAWKEGERRSVEGRGEVKSGRRRRRAAGAGGRRAASRGRTAPSPVAPTAARAQDAPRLPRFALIRNHIHARAQACVLLQPSQQQLSPARRASTARARVHQHQQLQNRNRPFRETQEWRRPETQPTLVAVRDDVQHRSH